MMQLTGWYCLNWHNLTEQSKRLPGGDVFNVGPMESGKTTWVDAVQLVLTAGVNMEWNSAADPTMTKTALKEKGRSLHGVVFREEKGRYRTEDKPNRCYFAIELTNGQHSIVLGICAYGSSHRSKHIDEWWIYAPGKTLKDLQFKRSDDKGEYALTEEEFQAANGRGTLLRKAQYRVAVAKILFADLSTIPAEQVGDEARSRMDELQRFLNLAKSYGRLNSASIDDLFRDALPRPDEDRLHQARMRFAEIDTLRKAIKRGEDRLENLAKLQKSTERVREQRIIRAGTNYGEAWQRHEEAHDKHSSRVNRIASLEKDEDKQGRELAVLDARLIDQTKFLADLQGSEEGQLMAKAVAKRTEVGLLETAALQAEEARKACEASFNTLQTTIQEANKDVTHARADLFAVASQNAAASTDAVKAAYTSLAEACRKDPSADIQNRLVDLRNVVRQATTDLDLAIHEPIARKAILEQEAKALRADLEEHRRHPYPTAMPGLDEAIADVKNDVIVVHRSLAIRPGRAAEAVLLEQYLPADVLGAIVPLDGSRTDHIRRKVHGKAPELRVVDRDQLADSIPAGILDCLDPENTHPLALAYLVANYGNVEILDKGTERGDRPRVVWRDGRVYDGIAWTLQDPRAPLKLLGAAGLQAHQARELELADALDAKQKATADAQAAIETLARQKAAINRRVSDMDHAWTKAALDSKEGLVAQHRIKYEGAQGRLADAVAAKASADNAWRLALLAMQDLEAALKAKGRGILDRLQAAAGAVAETDRLAKAKRKELGGTQRLLEEFRNAVPALLQVLEFARRDLATQRQQLLALGPDVNGDFDVWAKEKGFTHTQPASLKTMFARATGLERDAVADARQLCEKLAQDDLAVSYDEATNQVRETNTPVVLTTLILRLQSETASERKQQIQKIETIQQEQIVGPIAERMKRNIELKDRLVHDVNAALSTTSFNGDTFKLRAHERKDTHQGFLRLIREYDATDNAALVDAIRDRLQGNQDATQLLESFDYRRWFTFNLHRVDGQEELSVTEHRAKASGGGQAAPHYILMFILLGVFYNSHVAKLRVAFLDEAFRGVDSGHALHLIELAKRLDLTLLTADTEKSGHPSLKESAAVQQFARSQTGDAFVMTFSQAFGTNP